MRHTRFQIDDDTLNRIENLLSGTETVSQFAAKATEQRVNRLEARDERARIQLHKKDISIFLPIVEECLKRIDRRPV